MRYGSLVRTTLRAARNPVLGPGHRAFSCPCSGAGPSLGQALWLRSNDAVPTTTGAWGRLAWGRRWSRLRGCRRGRLVDRQAVTRFDLSRKQPIGDRAARRRIERQDGLTERRGLGEPDTSW